MSDEPREPEDEDAAGAEGDGEDAPPPPSTYAGRSRAEREARGEEESAPEVGEEPQPEAPPAADADAQADADAPGETGFTEEFNKVERDLQEQIERLEGSKRESARADHPVIGADSSEAEAKEELDALDPAEPDPADEMADPPDEFAFDENDGAEESEDEDAAAAAAEMGDGEPAADDGDSEKDSSEPELADVSPEVAAAAAAGETIEADTLSLADREAAKEAAMEGLRSRTKQQEELAPSEKVKKSTPAAAKLAGEKPPPKKAIPVLTGLEEGEDPGVGGAGKPPKRRSFGWRFVAAASLVIMSVAAATAINSLLFLDHFANGLSKNDKFASIQKQLAPISGGGPQTIMFLGSDSRAKDPGEIKKGEDPGRSDTTLLARIDPDKNTINLLSLPRDLKVNIPGVGVDKLNAAYSYGGQDLTLKTVKNLLDIEVNHVVNINFDGFYDAVNAIDCVYIDVDHHYFHSNEGLDPSEYYDEIDIPAGYQRLCGYNALNYVRYRHDDNDLIRGARQQDFVRELRQRIPPEKVFDTQPAATSSSSTRRRTSMARSPCSRC